MSKPTYSASTCELSCFDHRCRELQEKVEAQHGELLAIGEQLMIVVKQKFELQLQLEAWQVMNDKLCWCAKDIYTL